MVSLRLALAFGAEVVLCVLACIWAWGLSVARLPLGTIVVVVVATLIILRVVALLVEFLCSYLLGSPREPGEQIGFLWTVRMIVTEVFSFLLVFCLLLPLARHLVVTRRGTVTRGRQLPVLFIHGYASNAGIWAPMIQYLTARGLTNVFTMNLHPRDGDIDDFSQQVAARVNRICNTTRSDKVILVGHNMGGLVARAYVERCGGGDRVAKVICIGTPHHGTVFARLTPKATGSQMRIGSAWLRDLNRDENRPTDTTQVSIYSAHDNIIVPQSSAELGRAKNIRLKAIGHFSMLLSREVGQLVYRELVA